MRLLMRGGRPPHAITSNEGAVGWRGTGTFGTNIGNMLFSDSVYRTLNVPDVTIVCDAYAPEWREFTAAEADQVNEQFDAYVLPLANAFRSGFADRNLPRLTALIERLSIPVVVVGVGGQMALDGTDPELSDAGRDNTIAFVRAVLERSESIGVRGELTRTMLGSLGLPTDRVEVIGCPSMYVNSRDFTVSRRRNELDAGARIAMSLEGAVNGVGDDCTMSGLGEVYAANEREYDDLIAVYQTLAGIELVLWGEPAEGCPPGTPQTVQDRAYREDRLRAFTHPRTWREFLRERDFAFGVRIHGNVAALTAGTPAVMLSTDSRTQELADYHAIPQVPLRTAVDSGRYLARHLHEDADLDPLNRMMPEAWDRYHQFLERNDLRHIHQPGQANPAYEQQLAEATLPPPIRPLTAADPEGLATRVRWLRQGRAGDRHRPRGGYQPEFSLDATNVKTPTDLAKELRTETRKTRKKHESELTELRQQVAELSAQVEAYESSRFERRVADAVRRRARRMRD